MTREEAIQYAEKKLDSACYRLEMCYLNNGLRKIVSNEYEFFMRALSALRQQEAVTANQLNDPLKEFAEDVARQFAYRVKTIDGHAAYSTGGLSTLETTFDILGWDEPHPCPECECEADGCHEWATCGTPTKDGYKRLCGKHSRVAHEEGEK